MAANRDSLLNMLLRLCSAIVALFLMQFIFGSSGMYCFYFLVPLALPVLLLSPIMPDTTRLVPQIFLGLWLALFLRSGFDPLFHYDFPLAYLPWVWFVLYGLILGLPLLVVMSGTIASLGPIRLTICAGLALVLMYDVLNLVYGFQWNDMVAGLNLGYGDIVGFDNKWSDYLLYWLERADWISFRLVIYLGLGYLLAKRKGFFPGIAMSILVALADSVLAWLVFLPGQGQFPYFTFSVVLQDESLDLVEAVLAQAVDLTILALAGALVALIRWPRSLRRPLRYVPATTSWRRPSLLITPGAGPESGMQEGEPSI